MLRLTARDGSELIEVRSRAKEVEVWSIAEPAGDRSGDLTSADEPASLISGFRQSASRDPTRGVSRPSGQRRPHRESERSSSLLPKASLGEVVRWSEPQAMACGP